MRQFAKRGYDNVSVAEICADVGVSARSFFRYFPIKDAVVYHDVEIYRDTFTSVASHPKPGESGLATVKRASLAVAAEVEARIEDLRPRLALIRSQPALLSKWAELDTFWHAGIVALLKKDKVADPDIIAGAMVGAINAALSGYVASPRPLDLRRRVDRVFQVVRGV